MPSSDNAWMRSGNYASVGNASEYLKTRDPSIEIHGISNNFSTGTEMIASKPSCRA
jgi:hypothetical protein